MPPADERPLASVVVPTRARQQLAERCLGAVLTQETERPFEVVVVDDGGFFDATAVPDPRVTVVRTPGLGPAAARNLGIERARGEIVLFTDDDTVPEPGWVEAACAALAERPDAVGVEGPTVCGGFDPLFEHSVVSDRPGAFFTCNVAYRRADLLAIGGFDTGFPRPHCEDVDLGRRMLERGPILFVDDMRVVHPPRRLGFLEHVRRARWIESEWLLHSKHPELRPPRWTLRWGPFVRIVRRWQRLLLDPQVVGPHPRRAVRAAGLAAGQIALAFTVSVTRWRR